MLKLIVDGKPVEVAAGSRVIAACQKAGSTVPHFCYHPGLSVAGNCRMCMVEIEMNGRSRVAASCVEPVADGMTIRTSTPDVDETRLGMMEFFLLNHPVDCPVCDQSGECKLQTYYDKYGDVQTGSRRDTDQVHKPKRQAIGPHVMLDAERCVLCTRCVRFCEEYTGSAELGIENRGASSTLHLAEGRSLDNAYSGNVVDLCPVGAMTDRDQRFKRRSWFLKKAPSICTGCSRGCNLEIHFDMDHNYKGDSDERRVVRFKPRFNEAVNQWWLCDRGRYQTDAVDMNRLMQVRQRFDGKMAVSSWKDALKDLAGGLSAVSKRHSDRLAVLFSPQMTSEALLLARTVFLEGLSAGLADFELHQEVLGEEDALLMKADLNPNRKACEALDLKKGSFESGHLMEEIEAGKVDTLVCFRHDLPALLGDRAQAILGKLKELIVVSTHEQKLSDWATMQLPVAVWAEDEGCYLNFEGRAQIVRPAFEAKGDARREFEFLMSLASALAIKPGFQSIEGAQRLIKPLASHWDF
jgi:NADH-quinone oxidoreductase subunit G